MVCSNGAVTARLDPAAENGYEIAGGHVRPGPALRTIAMELPDALYAVEDLGLRAFRVSADFPDGGAVRGPRGRSWEELPLTPATRVVIRSPDSTPEAFHELVERVGLHEVDVRRRLVRVARPTPGGVSKASALEEVRQHLGVQPHGDRGHRGRRERRADAAVGGPRRRDGPRLGVGPGRGRRGDRHDRGRRRGRGPAQPARRAQDHATVPAALPHEFVVRRRVARL